MNNYSLNENGAQLSEYETPFADTSIREQEKTDEAVYADKFIADLESPFSVTYEEAESGEIQKSPVAGDFVNFLSELHNDEFEEHLYEMALELEDTWNGKISNEAAMGDRFIPYATQEANNYFAPLYNEATQMIDRVSEHFSGNNLSEHSESEIERFFNELMFEHAQLSPAQDQFFGSLFNKVKSVVNAGVNLAKKGISVVGKFLPINIILNKLKGLVQPLLNKVLNFAIGKLPKNLQPYAQTLAKKFLNLETSGEIISESNEIPAAGDLHAVQTELDNHIANLVFSAQDSEADNLVMEYESSSDNLQRQNNYETGGINLPSLDTARQQFINELRELEAGQSPSPAIERFIPAVIMALSPVIKIAISIIGRQKVINFLAGFLAKLVGRYVPSNIAQPLAASIIDVGMSAIGFEAYEVNKSDLAYEAIANTIQETIQNLGEISEETLNDQESLMAEALEAFEIAAANNFPSQYLKANKRLASEPGTWVMMPRSGPRHLYKKYTRVFEATLDNRIASTLTTFRGIPLTNFLKDKFGLDLANPVKARVHLYEAIEGTKLYMINRFEKIAGMGLSMRHGYKQLNPLTVQAASLLLNEPKLGRDFPAEFTTRRHHTAVGQRFYYLEIPGVRLKTVSVSIGDHQHQTDPGKPAIQNYESTVPNSSDIQGVLNFVRSEIRFNYYLSEEDAKSVAQKLTSKDFTAFISIYHSIRNVLHGMLLRNIGDKVKIVHEAMPEMFLEDYEDKHEQFSWSSIGSAIGGAMNAGKYFLKSLIQRLINKIAYMAYQAVIKHFKARANEFINAQAMPQDGVTIKVIWLKIPGMSTIGTIINAFKGRISLANFGDLKLPDLSDPEVQISAGKNFD